MISPGEPVEVTKVHEDGRAVTRYRAHGSAEACAEGWFAVESPWVTRPVEVHGLRFETGDLLIEFLSTGEWFNVFRVQAPDGEVRGWYANVTYPASLDRTESTTTVTWRDLYLDVIKLANGQVLLCDEDELAAADISARDPDLHARIVETAGHMMDLAEAGAFPFHHPPRTSPPE